MDTIIGYALLRESDDEMFIGSVIKRMREKCSQVYYDYQNDTALPNALNLASKIMCYDIDELWLINLERLPQENLFFTVAHPVIEHVFEPVLESLKLDFEYGGLTPLCIRDEKEDDSKEVLEAQKALKNLLKECFGAYEANLVEMIKFGEESGNLKVHYLYSDAT